MMCSVDEEDEDDLDDPSQQDDPAPILWRTNKLSMTEVTIGENPETSLKKKLRDVCNPNTISADNARDSRYFWKTCSKRFKWQ